MDYRHNILILLDESSDAPDTITSALTSLDASNPHGTITIIRIIETTRDQQCALQDTTSLLQSFADHMNSETKLYVYVLPQEMRGLEFAVSKLVKKVQPDLLVFALTICDSVSVANYYFNELRNGHDVHVKYVTASKRRSGDTEDNGESDEEGSSPWCIQNVQRCTSPIGWD
ncbi:hypothetical protein BDR26DRAFT_860403 [Obelidium mucronatum]|nr:hypothetical protein BDR26DRAFT_860403 [Obelidium mucronatum]